MRARAVGRSWCCSSLSACTSGGDQGGARHTLADPTPRGGTLRLACAGLRGAARAGSAACLRRPGVGGVPVLPAPNALLVQRQADRVRGARNPARTSPSALPEVSADGLTWTFRSAAGLRYAPPFDDTPITALDLVRALERTARVGAYRDYFEPIRGFERLRLGRGGLDRGAGGAGRSDARRSPRRGDRRPRVPLLARGHGSDPRGSGRGARRGLREVRRGVRALHGRGVRATRLHRPTGRAGADAPGSLPPVLDEDGPCIEPGSLVLVRNPLVGPGDRPAPRRLRGPDRVHARRPG